MLQETNKSIVSVNKELLPNFNLRITTFSFLATYTFTTANPDFHLRTSVGDQLTTCLALAFPYLGLLFRLPAENQVPNCRGWEDMQVDPFLVLLGMSFLILPNCLRRSPFSGQSQGGNAKSKKNPFQKVPLRSSLPYSFTTTETGFRVGLRTK